MRLTARMLLAGTAFLSVSLGAALAPAAAGPLPQTREHVLLAVDARPAANGEVCSDWTNEDGTHGTNCPEPVPAPGGGGGFGPVGKVAMQDLSFSTRW